MKERFLIILFDTLWLNCSTCFLIYNRNASELHRPISMMVYTGTSSRYIAIAAPDLMECVPISEGSKPNLALPIAVAAARRALMASALVTKKLLPLSEKVLTNESLEYDLHLRTRDTTRAQLLTGHNTESDAVCIVIVSLR